MKQLGLRDVTGKVHGRVQHARADEKAHGTQMRVDREARLKSTTSLW